jgi:cytochrome c553
MCYRTAPENHAMADIQSRVIVGDSVCARCAVPTKQVHHRDFPEIRVEGGSVAEGAAQLAERLARARENIGSVWHREAIEQAMADVAAFLDTLADAGQESEDSCRCAVRDSGQLESTLAGHSPSQ